MTKEEEVKKKLGELLEIMPQNEAVGIKDILAVKCPDPLVTLKGVQRLLADLIHRIEKDREEKKKQEEWTFQSD